MLSLHFLSTSDCWGCGVYVNGFCSIHGYLKQLTKPTVWRDEPPQASKNVKARKLCKNSSVLALGRASSSNASCGEQINKPSDGEKVNGKNSSSLQVEIINYPFEI